MSRARLRSLFVGLGLGLATAISIAVAAPPTKVGDLQVNGSAAITGSAYVGNTVTIAGGPIWKSGASAPVGACVTGSMYSVTSNVAPGFYVCSASAWVAVFGGTLTGSGTSGDLASWTGTSTLGNYAGSGCGSGSGVTALSPTGAVTCAILGITNSAGNNVIPKSNGTNLVASSISDDGTNVTTPETIQVNGGAAIQSNGNIVTSGGTIEGNLIVGGAGNFSTFLGGNGAIGTVGFSYFTNGNATGFINNVGYSGGTTQFRSLEIDDGKGSAVATFDGSNHDLDLASHKVVNLANGTGTQDGAAFGQIATAVNAGINGTTNLLARFTGTHAVGNSNLADDGTNFIVTSGAVFSVNESSGNTFVGGTFTGSGAATMRGTETVWGNWTGSGNVTLGSSSANSIAFNGSASTTLDMNSHKILDVTNGTAAQDAAAFGQIATGVNAAVSGTSGRSTRFSGTNTVGNGAFTDDGTNATINGVLTAAANLISTAGTTTVGNFRGVIISPTLASGTTNNWAPTGYATSENIYAFCNAGNCTLTGLQGGADGRHIRIVNTGSSLLSIPNASGLSSAGNQFNNSQYGGTVNLVANSGCEVEYVFSTASNFWTETGYTCFPFADDGTGLSTARNVTTSGNISTSSSGTISSNSYVNAGTEVYGNGGGEYFTGTGGNGIGFGYSTNAASTAYINSVGYNESTTQPRTLWIQDGQGSASGHSIAQFDGGTHDTTFPNGNVISHARFVASSSSGTSPMMDWKQAGQTEWQMYQIGSTNGMSLWNSTAGTDVTTWDSAGDITQTKGASFTSTTLPYAFSNSPSGGAGTPDGVDYEDYDEFLEEVPSSVTGGGSASVGKWTAYTSGTGAAVGATYDGTNGLGRPGQRSLAYTASTAANGYAAQVMGKTIYFPDGNTTFDTALEFPTLSSTGSGVSSLFVSQMGFTDGWAGLAPTNGCYFGYDAGNQLTGGVNGSFVQALECWCSKSGTRTGYLINNTGNSDESFPLGVGTVAAGIWYRLKIVMTGTTRAEFYRNNVKVCDINTNIPNTSLLQTQPAFSVLTKQATGTGARGMTIDWARVSFHLTSVRSP